MRIPFEVAVSEPLFLKKHWDTLSFAQQAILLAAYGCPIDGVEKDHLGWTRLDYFWATQGHGKFDELGYLTSVSHPGPYHPREYRDVVAVIGVRGGKSDQISATAVVYEAVCGGHEAKIRDGKQGYILMVAQNLRMAKASILSVQATLKTIPFLGDEPENRIENQWTRDGLRWFATADRVDLWNGMCILATPPMVKSIRGFDSPMGLLDEIGVWPTEADKANVDDEVYNQVSSRQATFGTSTKIFSISSPWIMSGMLYKSWLAGTEGCKVLCPKCETTPVDKRPPVCPDCSRARLKHRNLLVLHMPTAAMGNPWITRDWLQDEHDKNPHKFARECLAQFQPASDGFLDPSRVDAAVDRGRLDRAPHKSTHTDLSIIHYVAAMDPAFKQDDFAFAIGHLDPEEKVVIDLVRTWSPPAGGSNDPEAILNEITLFLRQYGISQVLSDQYHFQSLQSLAMDRRWMIEPVQFTGTSKGNLYGNLQNLLYQDRLEIPDHVETITQLKSLQRTYGQRGQVSISAPPGMHDDLATVVALVASRAVLLQPDLVPDVPVKKTAYQECMESLVAKRRREAALYE